MKIPNLRSASVAVIGLGYVGLPLAIEFGKHRNVVGFDIDQTRIDELTRGYDSTQEFDSSQIEAASKLRFSSKEHDLVGCDVYIVSVPTPINGQKNPDLTPLTRASELVGKVIQEGAVVIYESTVYPGATEEDCVPVIEAFSRLQHNIDFGVGYSPERINPGDKLHRLTNITKITSGSTPEVANFVDQLYLSILDSGTFKASSIRVAEAAKVVENTQRDLNIALINELAIIFNRLEIDTEEVLLAAGTKWNFLPFRPGLVGGHCIGIDPYYLTYKSQSMGYIPDVILAGRRINDAMGAFVANELVRLMIKRSIQVNGSRVLILGLTFKENCSDLRNSRTIDIAKTLQNYGVLVDIHDPWVGQETVNSKEPIDVVESPEACTYDAIVIAVAHDQFREYGVNKIRSWGREKHVLYDLKYIFDRSQTDKRL
jgi:UDP-N-acetyl-D-galactosamine dehydrogenase